jgi:hypothetical protein
LCGRQTRHASPWITGFTLERTDKIKTRKKGVWGDGSGKEKGVWGDDSGKERETFEISA